MEFVREKFQKIYSEESFFSPSHYTLPFDYSSSDRGVEATNQICIVDRLTFECFLSKVGLSSLSSGNLEGGAVNTVQNNSLLIDNEKSDVFKTTQKQFEFLNFVLRDVDED